VLAVGIAPHVIPGMWRDGFGYEMSEAVVVTDTGVERVTNLPQETHGLEIVR
jgi:ectoine hydrolase